MLVMKILHMLMKTIGDYCDLYSKTDALLLPEVFLKSSEKCARNYKLDPCYYFSSPELSWKAMLKMDGVKLNLIQILT